MTRGQFYHTGLNSNYIWVGSKESLRKVGLYCIACDIYYSPNLTKQYTVTQRVYYSKETSTLRSSGGDARGGDAYSRGGNATRW